MTRTDGKELTPELVSAVVAVVGSGCVVGATDADAPPPALADAVALIVWATTVVALL